VGSCFSALVVGHFVNPAPVPAATAAEIDRTSLQLWTKLAESTPKAKEISREAKGILVFPSIMKGGVYGRRAVLGKERSVKAAKRSATTTRRQPLTACKPARRCTVTRCSS